MTSTSQALYVLGLAMVGAAAYAGAKTRSWWAPCLVVAGCIFVAYETGLIK